MVSKRYTVGAGPDGSRHVQIHARGLVVLDDPQVNRGTAFTHAERDHLGLHGLLPHGHGDDRGAGRAVATSSSGPCDSDVEQWVFLTNLHDSNEVLFYKLVGEHVHEMLPIVYTPTVGAAIEQFSHLFRRPRGLFLSIDDVDGIETALDATGLGPDDIDLIVASDAEAILGIGDWGVGGIDISIGKLAVYTVAAGIDPSGCSRWVSTSAPTARSCSTTRATSACATPACAVSSTRSSSTATSRWRPSGSPTRSCTGRTSPVRRRAAILARYGDTLCTFDDDIQGTAAVGLACVLSGVRVSGGRLVDQQIVVFGAGSAGVGIADLIALAMTEDGLTAQEAADRIYLLDRPGLLTSDMADLYDYQQPYAKDPAAVAGWRTADGTLGLAAGGGEPAPDDARRDVRRHRGVRRRGHPHHARALPASDHPADVQPHGAGRADADQPAGVDRRCGAGGDRQPVRAGRASTARRTGSGRRTTP